MFTQHVQNMMMLGEKSLAAKVAALFSAGEQGVWYDLSDFSTMFQNAAGTIPVTTVGQAVGRILDKSGRGNHATQTTDTKRPVLQQDASGRYYLLFDGIDDALQTASVNFTGTDKVTVWAGIHQLTDVFSVITELSTDRNLNLSAFTMATRPLNIPFSYGFYSKGTLDSLLATGPNYLPPITNTITGIGDISSDTNIIRANGVQVASIASDQGSGNYGNYPLFIGMRGGVSSPFKGRLYSLIVRGAQSTATQITNTEAYVNSRTGAY